MNEPLLGVVVSHGGIAEGLVVAVERITGVTGVLVPVSNEGCKPSDLSQRINAASGNAPTVVFVDMPVGSCLQAAARCVRSEGQRSMVSGVNLPMLLDFCFHRDVTPSEAAQRAVSRGTDAIKSLGT